jgi:phosphate transport system substrate-binding protein
LRAAKRSFGVLIGTTAALALVAAACSADGDSIDISGSSTVEPISSRVAELFDDAGNTTEITVDGPGTGDGFELFCDGETDISNASRPIRPEEVDACEANGVEFIELKIGFDGIAVITSPDNADVDCLNFADLYALVGPESDGFGEWFDAQSLAAELGSTTTFPDARLDVTAPGSESGTYDSFIEIALSDIAEERVAAGNLDEPDADTTRADYTSQANDNAILQAIEGSPSSLGWVGFAFAEEAGDQVKVVAISEQPRGECVLPSSETIADGSYPLARALYIYVNAAVADSNVALPAYVDFYLGDGYVAVEEVGYVALPPADLARTEQVWAARTTGTRDGRA